jgi:hypothetical protein
MADVDEWQRVRQPTWSVTLDGYTYRAHPVSARAVADLVPKLAAAKGAEQFDLLAALYRLAFPWRLSYVWRGDPVKRLMALPLPMFQEVRDDFFVLLGVRKSSNAPATSGTP